MPLLPVPGRRILVRKPQWARCSGVSVSQRSSRALARDRASTTLPSFSTSAGRISAIAASSSHTAAPREAMAVALGSSFSAFVGGRGLPPDSHERPSPVVALVSYRWGVVWGADLPFLARRRLLIPAFLSIPRCGNDSPVGCEWGGGS